MNMYSAPLALSETASTYSPVGTLVRGQLADAGLSCLVDVFGGVSFSRFVAVMYRQVIVDRFIASWVAEGGSGRDDPKPS